MLESVINFLFRCLVRAHVAFFVGVGLHILAMIVVAPVASTSPAIADLLYSDNLKAHVVLFIVFHSVGWVIALRGTHELLLGDEGAVPSTKVGTVRMVSGKRRTEADLYLVME